MYDRILVPTDGSEGANAAVEHAVDIARQYDATVHALYVVDVRMSPIDTDMDPDEVVQLIEDTGEKPTTHVLDRARSMAIPTTETIRLGVPHEVIRDYIDENDIDLVVMGTHGRTGLKRTLLGSTTERLIRTVDIPVMAVHSDSL